VRISTLITIVSVVDRVRPAPSFAVWTVNPLMAVDTTSSGAGLRA